MRVKDVATRLAGRQGLRLDPYDILIGDWPQVSLSSRLSAHELPDGEEEEPRVRDRVAAEQAPGLARQTEEPFRTAPLHPAGRPAFRATVEVEGGPNRQDACHLKPTAGCLHPILLLRSAETDPDEVGGRGLDALEIRFQLCGGGRPERRRRGSDYLEPLKVGHQAPFERLRDARGATVEVVPRTARAAAIHNREHKVRTRDPLASRSEAPGHPDQGHPVRRVQGAVLHRIEKGSGVVRCDHQMDIAEVGRPRGRGSHPFKDRLNRLFKAHHVDGHAEDPEPRHVLRPQASSDIEASPTESPTHATPRHRGRPRPGRSAAVRNGAPSSTNVHVSTPLSFLEVVAFTR